MNKSLEKKEDYSKDKQLVEVVRNSIFKNSTDAEMVLYLYKCQECGVNPLSRKIIPIVFQDHKTQIRSLSFISTIGYLRSVCEESGDFAGMDEIEFEGEGSFEFEGKIINHPEKATCKLYRTGFDKPFIGIVYWSEYYPGDKKGHMWRQMPRNQLAKCAEAAARRLGWPGKLDQLYTPEEMERGFQALADGNTSRKPNVTTADIHVSDGPAPETDFSDDIKSLIRPSDAERESGRLVSEKQGFLMYSECKKSGIDIGAVAAAAKVKNIFWLTWQKSCKTNFNVMLDLVKNKPNAFAKFSQAANVYQTAANGPSSHDNSQAPSIMGMEEFSSLIESLAMQAGITASQGLKECCAVDTAEDVLPDDQSRVIDWFTAKADTAGA